MVPPMIVCNFYEEKGEGEGKASFYGVKESSPLIPTFYWLVLLMSWFTQAEYRINSNFQLKALGLNFGG